MSAALKVLHLETGRHLFGGAQQVAYLLPALRELGVESVLVCPPGAALATAMRAQGFVVEEIPCGGDLDLAFIGRFKAAIARHSPGLVHLHSRRGADLLGGLAAHWAGVPALLSRRVDNPEARLAVWLKYRLYARVVAISEGIARVLQSEGLPAEKLCVIRDAVDPAPWQQPAPRAAFLGEFGLAPEARVIAVVAQLIARKGHRVLLAALQDLLPQYPQLQVIFFGQGPLAASLQAQVAAAGWDSRVRFAGFREDLPRWLAHCELLAHPALLEGLGVSLLQASAAGVPVVASQVGGIPEAIVDGRNGLLVPPGDAAALAVALERLLSDPVLRQHLHEGGPQHVAQGFLAPQMAAAHLSVYRQLARTVCRP